MQEKLRGGVMRIFVDMVDSPRVERTTSSDYAVNLVVFFQQHLCQVGTVLACDSSNKCESTHQCLPSHVHQKTRKPILPQPIVDRKTSDAF